MADEIIEVVDSSDDEEDLLSKQQESRVGLLTPEESLCVELLDSDNDDDSGDARNSNKEMPAPHQGSYKAQYECAKKQSLESLPGKSKASSNATASRVSLSQSPKTNDIDTNDDSDSDDSLLYYQASHFQRKAKREEKCPKPPPPVVVAAAAMKPQGEATPRNLPNHPNSVPPASASSSASSATGAKSTPPVNPYEKPNRTPRSAVSKGNTENSTTPNSNSRRPIVNPYASSHKKNKSPPPLVDTTTTSSIATDDFLYPQLLSHSKLHSDVRAKYVLALWKYARSKLTHHAHHAALFDQTMNHMVDIALLPFPLRSLDEYLTRIRSRGGSSLRDHKTAMTAFQSQLDEGGLGSSIHVPVGASSSSGKYCTIVEACLVAMKQEIEGRRRSMEPATASRQLQQEPPPEVLKSKTMLIPLTFLIANVDRLLLPHCPAQLYRSKYPDGGLEFYLEQSTRSAEYGQIKKLASDKYQYIKVRSQNKETVFELTTKGWHAATMIQQRVFPAPPGPYRASHILSRNQVQPAFQGICLGVDIREGGLHKQVLHKMCNKLDMTKVPYFVGCLDIGDYCFFDTDNNNKLLPILVERKSVQDLAQSISDGRWKSQKHRMYHGQYVFGYDNCRMAYIVEGKIEKQQVTGGYIAHRKFGVDRQMLDDAIQSLESECFDVLRSTNPENSMLELSRWAQRVAQEVREGKLKAQYTFEEFKAQVKKIPRHTDFSRLAKDYKERMEAAKLAAAGATAASTIAAATASTAATIKERVSNVATGKARIKAPPVELIGEEIVDLCSDDDGAENDYDKRTPTSNEQRQRKSNDQAIAKQCLGDVSASSLANTVRSTSRFKPSDEVRSFFNNDGGNDSDSDSNSDCDSVLAKVEKTISKLNRKKQKKLQKRKKHVQEEAQRKTKKQKITAKRAQTPPDDDTAPLRAKKCTKTETGNKPNGDYESWSISGLKTECDRYGLPKGGKKAELIKRLEGPKPPAIWLERKKTQEYVPVRHDVASAALLSALYLHERENGDGGMTKDELYAMAESLEMTKNPFSGGTTQTGPYHYDGWSSMSKLKEGQAPLIVMKKGLYKLTRIGPFNGYDLAKAVHRWSHEYKKCQCGTEDY